MVRFLLLLWCLGAVVAAAEQPPGQAADPSGELHWQEWLDRAAACQVLYLGENHDSALDHEVQRCTLQGLAQRGLQPAVVAEMFQLPSHSVLAEFSAGRVELEGLRRETQWEQRWGHSWELYQPIWRVVQAYRLPLYPLRNSSESGKQLGKLGVEGFTMAEREGLNPPPYEFGPEPERLRATFEAHAGKVSDQSFARFLQVQTLWEEFMAAQVRRALAARQRPVVVLVGKGHLVHGHGLAQRVGGQWQQLRTAVNPEEWERERLDMWWQGAGTAQARPQSLQQNSPPAVD